MAASRSNLGSRLAATPCALVAAWAWTMDVSAQDGAYFQQQVDHVVQVRLDDEAHVLHGHNTFTYTNNGPVALDTLWLHLWPNAYRDRNSALNQQLVRDGNLKLHFATEEERGRIDSLEFSANGARLAWGHHPRHADIGWVALLRPLASGASITIATPFRVKIPTSKFSRLGHTGQAYHITQWFPKPAVFDRDGWHAMPYLTQGEFYSEFGSYDVSITLPANYVVGATGLLQDNPEEEAWMDQLARSSGVAARQGDPNDFPASDTRLKTLRFVQDSVHDFAWFADKRFIVRKGSVTLERSGRSVTTWALFTPRNAMLWERVAITSLNESVKLYSRWVGDYPYAACTAIDGTISAGGGMEYPMITIIGDMGSVESLDNVIAHEVGHNWFYGVLGSNERLHPWMDEGMNSFVEKRYMRLRYPDGGVAMVDGIPGAKKLTAHITDGHRFLSEVAYRLNARRNLDQPIEECAAHYTQINYGGIVYSKTALVFDQLFVFLGEEVFDRCMHAYYEEWKFKHPSPQDVRRIFERESGRDLSWMFDELIGTAHKVDVRPVRLKGDRLTYHSTSAVGFPFAVTGWRGDVELGTTLITSAKGKQSTTLPWNDADRVRLDAGARTLDIDRRNNEVRSHGLFRRCAKPELKWLMGLEKDDRRSVYWTPVVAMNGHDGFQLGMAAYNTVFPSQRTEWVAVPLYGLGSSHPGGAARVEHHFDRLRSRMFQNIHLGLNARGASTFHDDDAHAWYTKLSPTLAFDLKRDPLTRPWEHVMTLRGVQLWHETRITPADGPTWTGSRDDLYAEVAWQASVRAGLSPTSIRPVLQWHSSFTRASLEVEQAFIYDEKDHRLSLRWFGGAFLQRGDGFYGNPLHAWGLSWDAQDMLFDHAYLERGAARGVAAQQFNKQQGAFKTPFVQGGSETWITALNMELDLPIPLPLVVFGSAGWVPTRRINVTGGQSTETDEVTSYFEGGLGVRLIRDVLEVWVPLVVSDRLQREEEQFDRTFDRRIRFVLALEKLDPTKALRRLAP